MSKTTHPDPARQGIEAAKREDEGRPSRLDRARASLRGHAFEQMSQDAREAFARGLDHEASQLRNLAKTAANGERYDVAASRFHCAASLWQRCSSILAGLGIDDVADGAHKLAEEATANAEKMAHEDRKALCHWLGVAAALGRDGWYHISTGYDPATGEQMPDQDEASRLSKRSEHEAYRALAGRLDSGEVI